VAEKDSPDFQGKLFVSFSSLDSSKRESESGRERGGYDSSKHCPLVIFHGGTFFARIHRK
jgi:hypothetical protein